MMKTLLLIALLGMSACQQNKEGGDVAGESPRSLTDEQYASIGYTVKERGEVKQSDWDAKQFGNASVTVTRIRSTIETKLGSHTYPRFKVIRERYADAEVAQKRFKRLRDFDPALISKFKNTDHDLRRGFCINDEVVIVTTDAVMFSRRYLDEATATLKKIHEIK